MLALHSRPLARRIRVALLGPYHSPNLGDTAIQLAVIQQLRLRRPRLDIVGVSLDARDTAGSLGIPAFPLSGLGAQAPRPELHRPGEHRLRWPAFLPPRLKPLARAARSAALILAQPAALLRIARFVRSIDLLIVSGGGQLDEFHGGAWHHPYRLQVWVGLARLLGRRVAVAGVGLDRLESVLSRTFVLNALRLAHYCSFRDAGTLEGLRRIGWRGEARICPDLALGYGDEPAQDTPPVDGAFAVINPISAQTWSSADDPRHAAYLEQLAAAALWLGARGIRLRIVCSQQAMDGATAERLAAMLRGRGLLRFELCEAATVDQFLCHVRGAALVVASRLHAAILSLLAGAPVCAVAPLRKVSQLMRDAGLEDYCVELQSVGAGELIERIAAALERQGELRERARKYVQQSRASLVHTYDDLQRLIDEVSHDPTPAHHGPCGIA